MLEMLTIEDADRRVAKAGVHERYKGTNLTRTMMHSTAAGTAFFSLCSALAFENKVDSRLRELVILRTTWRVGGCYPLAQHLAFARYIGMTDEDIFGIANPDDCKSYSDIDRAIIKMADELVDDAKVSDTTMRILQDGFPPEQLLELILSGGYWRMVSTVASSISLELDPGVEPWPTAR